MSSNLEHRTARQAVADVLAYKNANFTRQLRPGEDPSAVTDEHLREAVRKILETTNVTASPEASVPEM